MNKKILFLIGVIVFSFLFFYFRNSKEEALPIINERETQSNEELREIIKSFVGTPYQLGPLDEGENIYREDVFDCTTLVLVSASNLHSDNPEEKIKEVNYYPPGEVSYENRLHFSTYRNKVSEYFSDITKEVGGEYASSKNVLLNKDQLIDIDWKEEIEISRISLEDVPNVVDRLPDVAGVMFMKDSNTEIGLDINHEGFVLDGKDLIHASPNHGEVYREDFLNYLQNSSYDAVGFYEVN